jgi:hypothetical protein
MKDIIKREKMVMHTNKGWMDEHLHPQQYSKMSVQYNLDEV